MTTPRFFQPYPFPKLTATLQAIAATTPAPVTARPSVKRWRQ